MSEGEGRPRDDTVAYAMHLQSAIVDQRELTNEIIDGNGGRRFEEKLTFVAVLHVQFNHGEHERQMKAMSHSCAPVLTTVTTS